MLNNIKSKPLNLEKNGIIVSDAVKDLLRCMIQLDLSKRIKWSNIYKHKVFREESESIATLGKSIGFQDLITSKQVFEQNRAFYELHELQQID